MKIGVCGIACQKCPRRLTGACPYGKDGCRPRENLFCPIATCAFRKGVKLCFECPEFPCEKTKGGPLSYGCCLYSSGKEGP